MLATPYLAKARNSFAKLENVIPHRAPTSMAVTLTAAALALVPAGAALAATSIGAPAATHVSQAAPARSGAAPTIAKPAAPAAAAPAPAAAPAQPQAAAAPAAPVVAPPAPPAPAPAPVADDYKTTSVADLESTGLVGYQANFSPTADQWANAAAITQVAKKRGMTPYAAVIAVAVAMQESSLKNLNYGDRDSLGLFQQRPSMGWGSPAQLTDPSYAANKFLSVLQHKVPNYQHATLWRAAQTVQESGFPTAYAKWQKKAAQMVHAIAA